MLTFINITLTVLLLFVFLVISVVATENMKKIKPDDKRKKNKKKNVKNTKEGFSNSSLLNLCEKNGEPREADDLEKKCNTLNKKQCNLAECCSFIKFKNDSQEICGASRDGEPIFKNSKKDSPIEYYTYMNKKIIV